VPFLSDQSAPVGLKGYGLSPMVTTTLSRFTPASASLTVNSSRISPPTTTSAPGLEIVTTGPVPSSKNVYARVFVTDGVRLFLAVMTIGTDPDGT
jgi:hypothetical protein